MEKIFDSIFDAFRHFAPSSPLIQLENDGARFFRRTNKYQIVDMEDGYIGAFPGFPSMLYRGEYMEYKTCKASIFRSGDPDDVVIDELKIIEFRNILDTFPQVKYAIEDHTKVDYLALAQHYGLNTNLVDLSSEPEIAAYFATHRWINGVPTPVVDGVGCIRGIVSPSMYMFGKEADSKFHMIGLQCFQRPGLQAAYGLELDKDEDLNGRGWTVYFRQNAEASNRIHMNFHLDDRKKEEMLKIAKPGETISPDSVLSQNSWLFPDEEISFVADAVRKSKSISKKTVDSYGKPCEEALKRKGITINDEFAYKLSDERIKELENEYKDRPYGDVELKARLVYIPQRKNNS